MSYFLGIDLGTTYTAAAVHDGSPRRPPEVVTLGERGPVAPSVLCLRPDGGYVAGDAAERQALTDPERIARQFKRRLGDPTPLVVGGTTVPAEELTSRLLSWVMEVVVRARGGEQPAAVVLTHPANWGPYKRDLLTRAAELAGVPGAVLVTEPQAAAISYASQERVDPGAVVAVYDLGGGTFDAAVLRKEGDGGFTILGSPEGIERLGGIDVDAALFAHVTGMLGDAYAELDPDDDQAMAAVARLRAECTQAKEALSADTEAYVPVLLPTVQTEVRVTRGELEDMVRPTLAETVTALQRALRSASVAPEAVDHVLLVGGSSRIPLVAELVSAGLGRPVAVDAHPKHSVALGAAIVAARAAGILDAGTPAGGPGAVAAGAAVGAAAGASGAAPAGGTAPPPPARGAGTGGTASHLPPPPGSRPDPSAGTGRARPPAAPPPAAAGVPSSGAAPASPAPPSGSARTHLPPPPGSAGDGAARPGPGLPPPPGASTELPPGFVTDEERERRRRRERRKRMVLVALGTIVFLLALAYTIAISVRDDDVTLADVEIGECFNGDPNEVEVVDCDEPHRYELFAVAEAPDPDADYPGEDAVRQDGGSICTMELVDYFDATADVALANDIELWPVAPTEEQWEDGLTDTYCLATHAEGEALEGSIRGRGAAG